MLNNYKMTIIPISIVNSLLKESGENIELLTRDEDVSLMYDVYSSISRNHGYTPLRVEDFKRDFYCKNIAVKNAKNRPLHRVLGKILEVKIIDCIWDNSGTGVKFMYE